MPTEYTGIEVQDGGAADLDLFYRKQLPAIMLLNNAATPENCARIKQVSPNTDIFIRKVWKEGSFLDPSITPEDAGNGIVQASLPLYLPCAPYITGVLTDNEPPIVGNANFNARDAAARLNRSLLVQIDAFHANGLKVVGPNWSRGLPPLIKFNGYGVLDLLVESHAKLDFFSYHAYAATADVFENWDSLAGRFEGIYDEFKALGRLDCWKPIVLTEGYIDDGNRHGYVVGGMANYLAQIGRMEERFKNGPHPADRMVYRALHFEYGRDNDIWIGFDPSSNEQDRSDFLAGIGGGIFAPLPKAPNLGWCPFAVKRPLTEHNYWNGHQPRKAVVVHIADGPLSAIYSTFNAVGGQASALFGVGQNGAIEQYMSDDDSGWAVGVVNQPTWVGLIPNIDPNWYTVSIENGVRRGETPTQAMYDSLDNVLVWLAGELGISTYVPHVNLIGHYEIDSVNRAGDPGPFFNFDQIAARVNARLSPGGVVITPAEILGYIPFLLKAGIKNGYSEIETGEIYTKPVADGRQYILQVLRNPASGFVVGFGVPNGAWDELFYFDPPTGGILPVLPVEPPKPTSTRPQVVPDAIAEYASVEWLPDSAKPFYGLTGATRVPGVSPVCHVTVIKGGVPVIGASVINLRPDGKGEIGVTDASGSTNFNYGASSAFSTPGQGPFSVFVAQGAVKDPDTAVVSWAKKLSDTVHSLGDFQGLHQDTSLQFVEQT